MTETTVHLSKCPLPPFSLFSFFLLFLLLKSSASLPPSISLSVFISLWCIDTGRNARWAINKLNLTQLPQGSIEVQGWGYRAIFLTFFLTLNSRKKKKKKKIMKNEIKQETCKTSQGWYYRLMVYRNTGNWIVVVPQTFNNWKDGTVTEILFVLLKLPQWIEMKWTKSKVIMV